MFCLQMLDREHVNLYLTKNLQSSSRPAGYMARHLWTRVNHRTCISCHMTYGTFYINLTLFLGDTPF